MSNMKQRGKFSNGIIVYSPCFDAYQHGRTPTGKIANYRSTASEREQIELQYAVWLATKQGEIDMKDPFRYASVLVVTNNKPLNCCI